MQGVREVPANNLLLRASYDKVHAHNCSDGVGPCGYALQAWRVAAEQGR